MNEPLRWYNTFGSRLFRFVRVYAFDGRTDGQTDYDRNIVLMHSQSHHGKT